MLLKPRVKLPRITDVSPEILHRLGIEGLVLDLDNTLSTHHGQQLTDGLAEWLDSVQKSGIRLMLLSNSRAPRVTPFAQKIGLPFISLGLKPLPFGFVRARKALGLPKEKIAAVGDQIFTDVLGGNLYGISVILLTPILPEKSLRFRCKRKAERLVYRLHRIHDMQPEEIQ